MKTPPVTRREFAAQLGAIPLAAGAATHAAAAAKRAPCAARGIVGVTRGPKDLEAPPSTPHPHTGTGFLTSSVHARPADDSEGLFSFPDRIGRGSYTGIKAYDYFELLQLAYDGRELRIVHRQRVGLEEMVPGWRISGAGLTNPISDGDDLLVGAQGGRPGRTPGCGLLRWRRFGGAC